MGYLSLYRKWRPKTFDDLAGQKTVVKTLKNALINNRIAHAYLFCGPRGTGKTSTAKIFAKALNCEHGPTPDPCNKCFSCQQINSGRSVDVIEIDAASNRRIDEIRDLREKVKFSPSEGDYKVYIIDEVHMLTKEAFNALLKTLEEPPENVVFILATTEPHKVLSTIQSRCQRFDFSLLSIKDLKERLKYICEQEGISITDSALNLIARTAEGGMRDAISILDQAIAFSGDKVTIDDVNTILGKVDQQILAEIVNIISNHDTKAGLKLINEIVDQGKDMNQFVKDMIFYFRDLMLIKECGLQNNLIDLPDELKEELADQASKFSIRDLLRILEILTETDQKLKFASQPRLLLEMTMIKLASPETDTSMANIINRLARLEEIVEKRKSVFQKPEEVLTGKERKEEDKAVVERNRIEKETESQQKDVKENQLDYEAQIESKKRTENTEVNEGPTISMGEMEKYWEVTMNLLNKNAKTRKLRAFLLVCRPYKIIGNTLYIIFPRESTFHKTNAEKEIDLLERALKKVIGQSFKVVCIFEGEEAITKQKIKSDAQEMTPASRANQSIQLIKDEVEQDPIVQKALKIFGGKIIKVENE
ncbi:hypothetical protein BBF96_13935 [Anoxybacter fermentans]|uniref:DNA-directed DNA polymerase n=1 Tax=Anoxybacter fermentans TaxID=1323375 RepID=A0A3S9T1I6_9FIRM|nr:DNA polymerase III subunit gamma/tau [Anoxybacter fermentans]AZR74389.1 hypothetical protein BBF96_13935 [Anoxybacter fermentans]